MWHHRVPQGAFERLELDEGPAGAFKQKVTVSPARKLAAGPQNLILIS
jgi:hypothetical protein